MTQNDGGPAFPGPIFTQSGYKSGDSMGMSLRDYFAGQALMGRLANPNHIGTVFFAKISEDAYKFADALIAARDAK